MKTARMRELIVAAQPGDKLLLNFVDRKFDNDHVRAIIVLHGHFIEFDELAKCHLQAVADSGSWMGFRSYVVTVLEGFDADDFIDKTIGKELLKSVGLVDKNTQAVTAGHP